MKRSRLIVKRRKDAPRLIEPDREGIAPCAYFIYESEGCRDGADLRHWFQAELQLRASRIHEAASLSAP